MPIYDGFRATIQDAETGLPLPEYVPHIDPKTRSATCFIETRANQRFTITLRDQSNGSQQGTAVYVDGVYVDNGLTGPGIAIERKWYGKRVDHMHVRPFVFRDNPAAQAEDQTNRGEVPQDIGPPAIRNVQSTSDYLLHRVEYADADRIPATLYHVEWIDAQSGPAYLHFNFIYRSRQVLITKGIIPPPSPYTIPAAFTALPHAPLPPDPKPKKPSKKRAAPKKKDPDVKPDGSSSTTAEDTPPKRPVKRPKVIKPVKLESPKPVESETSSDGIASPSVEARRAETERVHIPFDVYRELAALRDEVKKLRAGSLEGRVGESLKEEEGVGSN